MVYNLIKSKCIKRVRFRHALFFCLFLSAIFSFLCVFFSSELNDNENKESPILNVASFENFSGIYDGNISTLGIKIELNETQWIDTNWINTSSSCNNSYNGFEYKLNRLDVRAYNIHAAEGAIHIANDTTTETPLKLGYKIYAQEFTTPSIENQVTIDSVWLFLDYSDSTGIRDFIHNIEIFDESFNQTLGGTIQAADNTMTPVGAWNAFDLTSIILEPNTTYNLAYMLSRGPQTEYEITSIEAWRAENKSATGHDDNGATYRYNFLQSRFIEIENSSSIDMLCNFSYKEIYKPEEVDLKCLINDVEFLPIYQKSLSTGSLGYEALLVYHFGAPPIQDTNITITTNKTVESLQIEIKQYYVYIIGASGSWQISNGSIQWNVTYPYYDIGAEKEELWFLYESDWELEHFYNTIGTEIEVFFGPITLYNQSFYGLFDLWGTPLGFGDCLGLYQSPNYCSKINSQIKIGEEFKSKGYLQLGKNIKFEAEIKNSFNELISGGIGNITLRNPSGQIVHEDSNLTSYNGILNSSEIYLSTALDVGTYEIEMFWTNGKQVAFYSVQIEVRHPEGYISPETILTIALIVSLAIASIPTSLLMRKYVRQRNWDKTIRDIFVLTKDGTSMYNYSFGIELRRPELISGMISALTSFVKEATGSTRQLRAIDQEDKKVLLNHGEYITVALLCDKDLPIIRKKLKKFSESFENHYGKRLLNWKGELSMFKEAEPIVTKYFPVSTEDKVIRGVRQKLAEFQIRIETVENPNQVVAIMRELTEFSSRYQRIINEYSFTEFSKLIKRAEQKIQGS